MRKLWTVLVVIALATPASPARAELVEEIVAWVNGDVITKSEYEQEEESMMSETYRRYSGTELDERVEEVKQELLLRMIDRRILVDHAKSLGFDMEAMADSLYGDFREQQQIESEAELERLLAQDGMTPEGLKERLISMYAPEHVLRFEVGSRVGVGDRELQEFYDGRIDEFRVPAEASIREIVLLADDDERRQERRAEAEALRERAAAGEEFAALAREHSEAGTREEDGLLGTMTRADLADKLADVAFTIPVGEPSEVLEMPYGFHLLLVDSRVDEHIKPIEEIRDRLRTYLENQKYGEELDGFLEKARSEAQWCVRPSYEHLLPIASPPCQTL